MIKKSYISSVLASILLATNLQAIGGDTTVNNTSTSKITVSNGTDNVTITSSGDLNVTNDNAILVDTTDYSGTISNANVLASNNHLNQAVIKLDSVDLASSGTITNSGTITSEDHMGIQILGINSGTITNSGTMNTENSAITVNANDGTITNSGTITTNSNIISIGTSSVSNGSIINTGTMTTNTTLTALNYGHLGTTGTVLNSGTIIGKSSIIYNTTDNNGTITNTGTITVDATGSFTVMGAGQNNYGTINLFGTSDSTTSTTNATAAGHLVYMSGTNGGNIYTSGTHDINSTNSTTKFVRIGSNNSGNVESNATITTTSLGLSGFEVLTGDNNGTITNNGSITANIDANGTTGFSAKVFNIVAGDNHGTITNNGDINVTSGTGGMGVVDYFVYVDDSSDGNITNSGVVNIDSNATVKGVFLGDSLGNENGANANIINSGTLDMNSTGASAYGVNIFGGIYSGATITNSGTITSTTDDYSAYGIMTGDANKGTIVNSGTINATSTKTSDTGGMSYLAGIYINGVNEGDITNSGTIELTSNGEPSTIVGIYAKSNSATILNSDTITVEAPRGSAYGMKIENGSTDSNGSILNTGTITMTDTNTSSANVNTAIYYKTTENSTQYIENNGTISVTGSSLAKGIYVVASDARYTGSIVNNGTITVTGNGKAIYSNGEGNITNTGTITGNISATSATLTNSGTVDGNISVDSLVNSANGTVTGTISSSGITNSGTITSDSLSIEGVITNNSKINAKSISLANLVMNDNSELNLTGTSTSSISALTLGESTTLTFNVYADGNTTDPNISGSGLSVGSAVTIPDSTTIAFDVTANDDNQTYMNDNNTTTIISASSLDTNLSNVTVTDNSALLSFTLQYADDANTSINAKISTGSIFTSAKNTTTKGAFGAGRVLDEIGNSSTNTEMKSFMSYINALGTTEEVAKAALTTTPTNTASMPTVSTQIVNSASNVVSARVNLAGGGNSGEEVFSDKNLWIKPFGGSSDQKDEDGYSGFSADYIGIGVGTDGEYADGKRAGIALFVTRTNVDTNGIEQSSKMNSYNLIGYHNQNIIDNDTQLLIQLGLGAQRTETSRLVAGLNQTATAKYTAINYMAKAIISRDYKISDKLYMKPSLSLSLSHYKNPDYSESGAGGMSLNVSGFRTNTVLMGLENLASYSIDKKTSLTARLGAKYDVDSSTQSVSSSYNASPTNTFATEGIESSAWSYEAGLGMNRDINEDLSFDLDYNFDGKTSGFTNHMVSAKFNYKF